MTAAVQVLAWVSGLGDGSREAFGLRVPVRRFGGRRRALDDNSQRGGSGKKRRSTARSQRAGAALDLLARSVPLALFRNPAKDGLQRRSQPYFDRRTASHRARTASGLTASPGLGHDQYSCDSLPHSDTRAIGHRQLLSGCSSA